MTLTQDDLFKQIAYMEGTNVAAVRSIFNSAEEVIFDYLSSTTPSEERTIKILNGLSLDSKYIPEHYVTRGMFQNQKCDAKIRVKAKLTDYYKDKINNKL